MGYWLVVYLFNPSGEFFAKDVYEAASKQQCIEFAGKVAETIVDTNFQASFSCISDEEYRHVLDKQP